MNTSMTIKISNNILDNEIIVRKKPLKKSNFSTIKGYSAGANTVMHSNYASGITSVINSGLRGNDEELRLSMLVKEK